MNLERIDGKPNLHVGVRIKVDDKEAVIEAIWAQGAHKTFKLSDGRTLLDLDKSLGEKNNVWILPDEVKEQPKKKWNL